ncbi:MAG: DASH family cryptochrome [Bacteroidia bacterium]|jgi:deoxyribodipyrimidine photo-lyase|nr:DASH family cryptochrome [Bacteroidia bacterium]
MKRSIVWFKTDLRLHDNETLVRAIEQSDEIIPVYCFDENHFKQTAFGFQKTGNFRCQFLLEALEDLDSNLRLLGSGLVLVKGKPEIELYKLVKQFSVQSIFAKREVAYEEKQTQALVEKEVWKLQCSFESYSTSTLYHAQDLPFSIKDIPDVFTTFKRKIEHEAAIRPIFQKPLKIASPALPVMQLPNLKEFGLNAVVKDNRAVLNFKGGEREALKRLTHYLFDTQSVSKYKNTRNELLGSDYSSKFSPWLAIGCLSPREIYYELKKYESAFGANDSTDWLIYELLWRDYFRFMMKKHHNKYFLLSGIKATEHTNKAFDAENLLKWIDGKTGNDFIDANMNELKLTGFMSNRGRQNVASYLCNDLHVDWRFGAAYFEQQLIDYDVCSNWGNWAYIAGVGNDPRGKRYFNLEKQALQYDPKKTYVNTWLKN